MNGTIVQQKTQVVRIILKVNRPATSPRTA